MFKDASRRGFLRTCSTLTAIGAGTPLALNLATMAGAAAQSAPSDYKAIVCLYLAGGNDNFDTFIPYDSTSYNSYSGVRGTIAQPRPASALATTRAQSGRQINFHSQLANFNSIYNAGRLAVLANVGPLTAPSSKSDLLAGRVAYPRQLGSHNDQSNTWLALATSSPTGWGGRMGDLIQSSNGASASFTTISGTGGYTLFLIGGQTNYFTVSDGGLPSAFFKGNDPMTRAIEGAGSSSRTNLLERAYVQTHEQLDANGETLQSKALAESAIAVPPSKNITAAQMRTIARIIGANQALGVKRQIFYVNLSGFDTHSGHADRRPELMDQLNAAVGYFDDVLGALGMRDNVTLFSASEFGRTYFSNGDGTDHGWGSHHIVMGGAVKGKEIYGTLPNMERDGVDFIDGGVLIPTTSVEQYGATLAKWFGNSTSDIDTIFPNIGRFASRDLGFMK